MFYRGTLRVERPPVDQEFGVMASKYAMLSRRVEIYCYKEEVSKRIEREGEKTRTVTDYKYTSVWVDAKDEISSEAFKDQNYNLNKKAPFRDMTFRTSEDILVDPAGFKVD